MLSKVLFWIVLVWMAGLLAIVLVSVRAIWRESSKEEPDEYTNELRPGAPESRDRL